jgi:hypothetical protein
VGLKYPRNRYPKGIPGVGIEEFPREWFDGVDASLYQSRRYDRTRNCYGVKSGLDQVGWEESGWICPVDPRGWTQWYFRFFMGRRLVGGEDERQIARWSGVCGEKGRWKSNLIAKCLREGKAHDDASVSPVVRQTLLHWAYELTDADFSGGSKRVKERGAAYVSRASLGKVLAVKEEAALDEEAARVSSEEQAAGRAQRAAKRQRTVDDAGVPPKRQLHVSGRQAAVSSAGTAQRSTRRVDAVDVSAYELQRDATRRRNQEKLQELGLA